MEYDTVLLGKWFLMFCENVVPSFHQTLGTTCQTTQCHNPQDLSLKNISNYTVPRMQFTCVASDMYTKLHNGNISLLLSCQNTAQQSHFSG